MIESNTPVRDDMV